MNSLKRLWTVDGREGYYIRKSDLPDQEQEALEKFLCATCRNAPYGGKEFWVIRILTLCKKLRFKILSKAFNHNAFSRIPFCIWDFETFES